MARGSSRCTARSATRRSPSPPAREPSRVTWQGCRCAPTHIRSTCSSARGMACSIISTGPCHSTSRRAISSAPEGCPIADKARWWGTFVGRHQSLPWPMTPASRAPATGTAPAGIRHSMRVAVVNWSSRRVGGIEEYVSILLPALKDAGLEVAFWHERNTPLDRAAIEPPAGVPFWCAEDMGTDASLHALRAWKPDVLYVQSTESVHLEGRVLDIAPAVFFLHTYLGTCISGSKS